MNGDLYDKKLLELEKKHKTEKHELNKKFVNENYKLIPIGVILFIRDNYYKVLVHLVSHNFSRYPEPLYQCEKLTKKKKSRDKKEFEYFNHTSILLTSDCKDYA
jgi:hypothetical protein